ncbi:MAG: mechanosensitive ion channel family protein [Candidatus Melainabacteria bacterium]|nr:mechanosensitive ion channel family protein [Candidatus Melainabacteria bacterium]
MMTLSWICLYAHATLAFGYSLPLTQALDSVQQAAGKAVVVPVTKQVAQARRILPEPVVQFLQTKLYGNTVETWILALLATLLLYWVARLSVSVLASRLGQLARRTPTDIDDFLVSLLQRTHGMVFWALGIYGGSLFAKLPAAANLLIGKLPFLVLVLQLALWANHLVTYLLERYTRSRPTEWQQVQMRTMMSPFKFIAVALLWSVLGLILLENLGFDITALVAGLGIGGVAIALATQNILSDLLASLSIVLDKPFVIGDFVIVDTLMGTVEHIGLKTTRIRSLSGEQLIFSNNDLLKSRIRNFKRMEERRVLFTFGVVYQTDVAHLEQIPTLVQDIITQQEKTRFDRAHFKSYGSSSLDFEVVYYVLDAEYNTYMDIQQHINLEMFRRFQAEGIEFAYPTQTVVLTPDAALQSLMGHAAPSAAEPKPSNSSLEHA